METTMSQMDVLMWLSVIQEAKEGNPEALNHLQAENKLRAEQKPTDRGAGTSDDSSASGGRGEQGDATITRRETDDATNGDLGKEVTPSVGPFGEIYTQFKGKPQEAVTFLLAKRGGEAIGALHHKEIGDIDLVWGEEGTGHSDGYGLAKLAKFHPEVLFSLQDILNDMVVTKRTANRVQLESDKYQAAVRLTWDDKKKTWLLTMFEKKNSVPDNTTDTDKTLVGNGNDTATPENTVSSEGKGNTLSTEKQAESEKSSTQGAVEIGRYTNYAGRSDGSRGSIGRGEHRADAGTNRSRQL